MHGASVVSNAIKQTARSSFVLRVVFQNLGGGNRLKDLVKCNVLLYHFLLRVLGDADVFCRSLSADSLYQVDLVKQT